MDLKETAAQHEKIKRHVVSICQNANAITEAFAQYKLPAVPLAERIQKAEEDLGCIHLTVVQRAIVKEIIDELAAHLPTHDFVLAGFVWRAIRAWQFTYQRPLISFALSSQDEQIAVGQEILENLRELLNRGIYFPDKQKKRSFLDYLFTKIDKILQELISVSEFLSNPYNHDYLEEHLDTEWE